MDPFTGATPDSPLLLDGGLSTELARRGHELSGALWSARVLAEDPRAVLEVHRDFAAAGARVLHTGTYQASVDGLVRHGVRPSQASRVIEGAVALARGGAEQAGTQVAVAGSCGPFAATLPGSAEFRGYGTARPTRTRLHRFHLERARLLEAGGADLLAFETLPALEEVAVVTEVADLLGVPSVVSVTTRDGRTLPDGSPLTSVAAATSSAHVVAIGVNCLAPEHAVPAIRVLAGTDDRPCAVRPNAGDRWEGGAWRAGAVRAAAGVEVLDWVEAGASAIGGCCGTTPADVTAMARTLGLTASG